MTPKTARPKANTPVSRSQSPQRYAQRRRRLLQSLAISGAAVSTRAIPEKWSRPILDTTLLPAHAQATTCIVESLDCELGSIGGLAADVDFSPGPPPYNGGTATVTEIYDGEGGADVTLAALSATVAAPECAGPVTLLVTSDYDPPDFDLGSGTSQTVMPVNGVATFGNVSVLVDNLFVGTANVDLNFSTDGASDCVIDISFVEPNQGGIPPPPP